MKRDLVFGRPQLECLEDRCCPSGLVTATLGADGTLLIKGDAGNNNIDVSGATAGIISVTGTNFTSVNGVKEADFNAASVARISIQLGDGNDGASVHDLSLPDKLTITDNKGNDFYFLSNDTLATGSISVNTGDGFDNVIFGDYYAGTDVTAGSVSINTGAATDFVRVRDSNIGALSILTGDGNDYLAINNDTVGTLSVDTGKNDDNIQMRTVAVSGAISVKAGDGNDGVHADNTTAGSGTVDGGGGSDVFENGGGNAGWAAINFEGFV
jgi:hypothetical protein